MSYNGSVVHEGSFEIISNLGRGHFGKVFLVRKKDSKELFALKVISKLDIIKNKFFENLQSEKKILEKIKNPFVVELKYCFASPSHIYFGMKFYQGGELYHHMKKKKRFTEKETKFYAAQIICGLCYLHSLDILYRDLKPENILMDAKGNVALADFGISKYLKEDEKCTSFVGTPEYVAPEIVLEKGHDRSVDIWCYGILLYEMIYGLPPFYNKNQNVMLKWIVKMGPTFPQMIKISENLKDLISKVL